MDDDAKEARKIYNKYAKIFEKRGNSNEDRKIITKIVLSLLGEVENKKILDAGCGGGNECKLLAKKKAKVFGIDVSEEMLKIAMKKCKGYGVKFFQRDMERTGFKDESFDIIISLFSIHYKRNLERVLKEFYRILREDGKILVVVPHPIQKMIEYSKNYFERGKHWEVHGEMKYFNYYFTLEDYINAFSKNFKIEKILEIPSLKEKNYPHFLLIKAEKTKPSRALQQHPKP